jgi:ABC-2 type transport system permease protein
MNNLSDMIWIEMRKAIRSRMPLWTALGSLVMPLGIAFLIFVSKNPEISRQLGLISVKADLVAYSATDWSAYLGFCGMLIAAGEFFLIVLSVSWVFGREFADHTVKDILAVPVQRSSILLAKFFVTGIWSALLTAIIFSVALIMGAVIKLPGGSLSVILNGSVKLLITACLMTAVAVPLAFFASLGRGYLLPLGLAVLIVMLTNLVTLAGWGEYFPWAVPELYAQGKSLLPSISYWIVFLTCLMGMIATYLWWKFADQNR